jgi:hypothetical protein
MSAEVELRMSRRIVARFGWSRITRSRIPAACDNPAMPRFPRRAGPIGLALTLVDVWRRMPPKQRKQALNLARKHGPRIAKTAMKLRPRRR